VALTTPDPLLPILREAVEYGIDLERAGATKLSLGEMGYGDVAKETCHCSMMMMLLPRATDIAMSDSTKINEINSCWMVVWTNSYDDDDEREMMKVRCPVVVVVLSSSVALNEYRETIETVTIEMETKTISASSLTITTSKEP